MPPQFNEVIIMRCNSFFCIYCKDENCLLPNLVLAENGGCLNMKSLICRSDVVSPAIRLCRSPEEDENLSEAEKREEFFLALLDKLQEENIDDNLLLS